jgi:hypothetical protein
LPGFLLGPAAMARPASYSFLKASLKPVFTARVAGRVLGCKSCVLCQR